MPLLTVLAALAWTDTAHAQATNANNTCTNPFPISADGQYDWDSQGATNSVQPNCTTNNPAAASPDVWFAYTPGVSGTVLIRNIDVNGDTITQVFSSCSGGIPTGSLACDDDNSAGDFTGGVEFAATAGTTYLVGVSGWGGAADIGVIDIVSDYQTANHTCATASTLDDGPNFLSTLGQGENPPDPGGNAGAPLSCIAGSAGIIDAWGVYTATCDGSVEFNLLGAGAVIQTFDACGMPDVTCDADLNATRSVLTGDTILVQVGTLFNNGGSLESYETIAQLDITCTPSMIFSNEDCADATALPTMFPISEMVSTVGAQPGLVPSCGAGVSNDLWFSVVAPMDGQLTASLDMESFTETVAIFDLCGGTELACVNAAAASTPVTMGQTLLIQVGGQNGETGAGTLNVDVVPSVVANDNCGGATSLTDGVVENVDTSMAAVGLNPTCNIAPMIDLWYSIDALCTGELVIALSNQAYDPVLVAYDACGGMEIECLDLVAGQNEVLVIPAMSGQTYFIQVGGFFGDSGTVDLTATCETPSAMNDDCGNAAFATVGANAYDSSTAGESGDDPGCNVTDLRDLWFEYTSLTDATVNFLINGAGDTIAVWDGCGGTVLGCDATDVTINMTVNQTVFVQLGAQLNTTGAGTLDITEIMLVPNDECVDALPLVDGPNMVSNVDSSTSGPDPDCPPFDPAALPNDTWYTYTASCTGVLTVSAAGSGFDTRVAAYSDCAGIPSLIVCDDDSAGNLESEFAIPVTMGDAITIQFFGFGDATGDGTLNITCAAPVPNDICANADPLLADGMPVTFNGVPSQDEGNAPLCTAGDVNDLWYEVIPSADGVLLIEGLLTTDAIILAAYDNCGGNLLGCAAPFALGAALSVPVTMSVPVYVQIGSVGGDTGEVSATLFSDDLSGQAVIVNADPGGAGVNNSAAAIEAALMAQGAMASQITTVPSAAVIIGNPLVVFNLRGTFPDNTPITATEGMALNGLVNAGVPVYTESGDTWGLDAPTDFNMVDGIDDTPGAIDDGGDLHMGMIGSDIFMGEDNLYTQDQPGGNDWTDELIPADGVAGMADSLGSDAAVIWTDDLSGGAAAAFDTGVRYTTPATNGNVISCSSEFAGWYQGDAMMQSANMGIMLTFLDVSFGPPPMGPEFIRGDLDQNGTFGLPDAIGELGVLFVATAPVPNCLDTADVDANGSLTLGDVIYLLGFLFQGGTPPPAPNPACGVAPMGSPTVGCAMSNNNCP